MFDLKKFYENKKAVEKAVNENKKRLFEDVDKRIEQLNAKKEDLEQEIYSIEREIEKEYYEKEEIRKTFVNGLLKEKDCELDKLDFCFVKFSSPNIYIPEDILEVFSKIVGKLTEFLNGIKDIFIVYVSSNRISFAVGDFVIQIYIPVNSPEIKMIRVNVFGKRMKDNLFLIEEESKMIEVSKEEDYEKIISVITNFVLYRIEKTKKYFPILYPALDENISDVKKFLNKE